MSKFILKINQASDPVANDENVACYAASVELPLAMLKELNQKDKMLLLFGDAAADVCKTIGADGVLYELDPKQPVKSQVNKIREAAGAHKVLGLVIPPHRHEAMLAAETEPEFIAFKCSAEQMQSAAEVLKWYDELFLIQSALDLSGDKTKPADIECDFVIINSVDYADFSC